MALLENFLRHTDQALLSTCSDSYKSLQPALREPNENQALNPATLQLPATPFNRPSTLCPKPKRALMPVPVNSRPLDPNRQAEDL